MAYMHDLAAIRAPLSMNTNLPGPIVSTLILAHHRAPCAPLARAGRTRWQTVCVLLRPREREAVSLKTSKARARPQKESIPENLLEVPARPQIVDDLALARHRLDRRHVLVHEPAMVERETPLKGADEP
eukprot:CAMPEP_0206258282 /NCGR_PEP_ID=MMETSP0047_2-20121206/25829_1 /ASSEMBLY_ACC=CAM_ASM_000192 /TAXON_ID=195065 /ORGANISM="Chroomonas mesostigmatica_cf, Strain CCMP1168" /LENGTH=128 /DNA_ID=CAMNT_0053685001 /DNA_START=353 /DNA_END=739 /DNA_ORIENTATION=-